MIGLKKLGGYLLAGVLGILGVLAVALRLIGIGEQKARAKTEKAQADIEHGSQEALNDAHTSSQHFIEQAHDDRRHGHADDLNDNRL